MKLLIPLFLAILMTTLFSCQNSTGNIENSHQSESEKAILDSTVEYLLSASAVDFYDHQPPLPVRFRNVNVRNLIGPNSENQYMICGQFLTSENQNNNEWISFATIKTSGYEQLIGKQSLAYCQDSKAIPYKTKDLSSLLKARIDLLLLAKDALKKINNQ